MALANLANIFTFYASCYLFIEPFLPSELTAIVPVFQGKVLMLTRRRV